MTCAKQRAYELRIPLYSGGKPPKIRPEHRPGSVVRLPETDQLYVVVAAFREKRAPTQWIFYLCPVSGVSEGVRTNPCVPAIVYELFLSCFDAHTFFAPLIKPGLRAVSAAQILKSETVSSGRVEPGLSLAKGSR